MHELIFKNDTIVIEKFKSNCGTKTSEYLYNIENDSITIYNFRDKENISYHLKNNELWNSDRKHIYLTYDKLEKRDSFVLAVEGDIWDGEKFESKGKRKRELKKFFKKRIDNIKDMKPILLKGYDAYIKFGSYESALEYVNK